MRIQMASNTTGCITEFKPEDEKIIGGLRTCATLL